ncbi:MAG: RecQ family ATP-dependent DNA helicase [Bacteroidales bacterium]|nr:RecQ family ATP-dependent DNA helicase [Bacteroidales bacterium]
MTPIEALRQFWGYDDFRPGQLDIINAAVEGRDVLAVMPTGGGKSICFQVPALLKDGLALVVTPLIALMKDQVRNLEAHGIKALAVHSGMDRAEVESTLRDAAYGDFKFLYLSPERLCTELFRSFLDILPVSLIVVDEAHCISQWGYDFRPEYLRIGELRKMVDANIIALTATATPDVCTEIMEKLSFRSRNLFRSGFERPNLSYIVRECASKDEQLKAICNSVPGSGIVYLRNRRQCEDTSAMLKAEGIDASYYHAGLSPLTRNERQEAWRCGKTRIMVCTNAFGMGIDKPDVRFVVHMGLPDSLEAYFQEAGRAGRDEKESYAVLLWNKKDVQRAEQLMSLNFPGLDYIEDIYNKLHVFYGIPYETGAGYELKFDIREFCSKFKLESPKVHYAIKYLEQSEHLAYDEDVEIPTRIRIIPERKALYDINVPDEKMVEALDCLMRSYTGIFNYGVSISEEMVARRLGISITELRQLLYRMGIEHLIRYIPCDNATVVRLYHNRIRPGDLDLQPKRYERLREEAVKRRRAMLEYAEQTRECRSAYLCRYFGQEENSDCGKCDVCRSSRSRIRSEALKFIAEHPGATVREISSFCADPKNGMSPSDVDTIREILDKSC